MDSPPAFLSDGPSNARATIALAHGAGAAMDSDFMNAFAAGLAKHKLRVVRFEFPYMAARRQRGKSGPPDREPVLRQTWHAVVAELGTKNLFIGGKSMGGRIASLVADELEPVGLICLGYPFHPTGKPDKLRIAHLEGIRTPTLILQGERDPFGTKDEVSHYSLSSSVKLCWLTDGDHSFKPRKSSGATQEDNWRQAIEAIASFVESQI
ncbi:MAG: alpha/beta fold hydrolase [Gemmataceae bacterium]